MTLYVVLNEYNVKNILFIMYVDRYNILYIRDLQPITHLKALT